MKGKFIICIFISLLEGLSYANSNTLDQSEKSHQPEKADHSDNKHKTHKSDKKHKAHKNKHHKNNDPAFVVSLAYNNPILTDIGVNLLARKKHLAVEGGFGVGFSQVRKMGLELDLKFFAGAKHVELFLGGGVDFSMRFTNDFLLPVGDVTGSFSAGLNFSSMGQGKGYNLYAGAKYYLNRYSDSSGVVFEIGVGYGFTD